MGVDVNDHLYLGTGLADDPVARTLNSRLDVGLGVAENVTVDASFGTISRGGHQYWTLGATYAFSDAFSATLAWHDTSIDKGRAVLSLDYAVSPR